MCLKLFTSFRLLLIFDIPFESVLPVLCNGIVLLVQFGLERTL